MKPNDMTEKPYRLGQPADGRTILAFGVLVLYAFGLLSIGLTSDWQLRHEDNGAMHTTLALSHLKLGLAKTRAHDVFYNPNTGERLHYGHHPPAPALLLAGAFALTGSTFTWVARLVPIVFHLGSLGVLLALLSRHFSKRMVLAGGFLMATLPMSAYFGRMMNYEPLCLFAVLLQLLGYAAYKHRGSGHGSTLRCVAICWGGFIDWGSFFFTAAIALVEVIDVLRRRSSSFWLLAVVVFAAVSIFCFDLFHIWYAGHGSLTPFRDVLSRNMSGDEQGLTVMTFIFGQLETFRRYYTHAGLLASSVVAWCLIRPRMALSKHLFHVPASPLLKRLLLIAGTAALGYVLAAPSWADIHHYWQFYFLPFVVISMLLVWQILWQKITQTPTAAFRALVAFCILDVLLMSSYMLYFRHIKTEGYAVRATAHFRSQFLSVTDFERQSSPVQ